MRKGEGGGGGGGEGGKEGGREGGREGRREGERGMKGKEGDMKSFHRSIVLSFTYSLHSKAEALGIDNDGE